MLDLVRDHAGQLLNPSSSLSPISSATASEERFPGLISKAERFVYSLKKPGGRRGKARPTHQQQRAQSRRRALDSPAIPLSCTPPATPLRKPSPRLETYDLQSFPLCRAHSLHPSHPLLRRKSRTRRAKDVQQIDLLPHHRSSQSSVKYPTHPIRDSGRRALSCTKRERDGRSEDGASLSRV
jgi:hypothetical protein